MSSSQADIDKLLAQAEDLAGEALGAGTATATAEPDATPAPLPRGPREAAPQAVCHPGLAARPGDLGRIMRIEVPVIVKLAECKMPLVRIVGLNTGAIIEFEKPADASLDLMINNKCIGVGQAVKVGENFGLRITQVGTLREKIEALGA